MVCRYSAVTDNVENGTTMMPMEYLHRIRLGDAHSCVSDSVARCCAPLGQLRTSASCLGDRPSSKHSNTCRCFNS